MTSSLTSFRPYTDQENAQPQALSSKLKGGSNIQGQSFGPTKTFKPLNAAPQATPRRALGDIGNTAFKPTHSSKLQSRTPGGKKFLYETPHNKARVPLLQQIASAGIKPGEPVFPEKEKMFPFVDKEEDLPQSESMKRILKNIKRIHRSCPSNQSYMKQPEDIIIEEWTIGIPDPGLCTEVQPWEPEMDFLNVLDISANISEVPDLHPFPELLPIDDSFFSLGSQ